MKDGEHVEERFHEKLNRFLTVSTVLQNTLLLINLKKSFSKSFEAIVISRKLKSAYCFNHLLCVTDERNKKVQEQYSAKTKW